MSASSRLSNIARGFLSSLSIDMPRYQAGMAMQGLQGFAMTPEAQM